MIDTHHTSLHLAADVGGTNTRIALHDGQSLLGDTVRRIKNADHEALSDVVQHYVAQMGQPTVDTATVAMAGVVEDGKGYLTNGGWYFDTCALSEISGTKNCYLINDLAAQGYAVPQLNADLFQNILKGKEPDLSGARLVAGMGTGFNVAPIFATENGYMITQAEAGQTTLAAFNDEIADLVSWLRAQTNGFVSVEDVLSGRGLQNCYAYASKNWENRQHPAGQIVEAANNDDPIAAKTLSLFATTCGTVLGDLALQYLPLGGITLVGGVSRSVQPYLRGADFATAFRSKGRLSDYMKRFSVDLIADDNSALIGCIAFSNMNYAK